MQQYGISKAGTNAKLPWNMVKNCIKNVVFFFFKFSEMFGRKKYKINDKFPLKIANISLPKANISRASDFLMFYFFSFQIVEMPEHNTGHMGGTMRLGQRPTLFKTERSVLSKYTTQVIWEAQCV